MLEKIKQWLEPPVFPEDEEKTRNARVLYSLLATVLQLIVPAMLAMAFVSIQKIGVGLLLFVLLVLVMASYLLVKRSHVQLASKLFVTGIWVLFAVMFILGGRTTSAASGLLISATVTAGILLGKKFAILLAILSSLTILLIATLEALNYPLVHFFPGPPIPSWATWTLSIFLTLKPMNLAIQGITQYASILKDSEERLRFVLEGSQLGYWDWNIKTGKVQRNTRWAEMLGYTLEEIEANVKQWTDLHHPDDRERAWKSIQDHLEGRKPAHKMEYRMLGKDGQYRWILDQARIVERDADGNPLRMSGTHTDITDRKWIEDQERVERELADALSDSATALNGTLNFEEVLNRIMDNVGRVVPHDAVNLMLLAADGDTLTVVSHRGYLERGIKNDEIAREYSLSAMPVLLEAAKTGKSITTSNTHNNPDWNPFPSTYWVSSYLSVPIQIRSKTVGFLNLDSEKSDFFSITHAERLQAFASHAAIAIENARLYEDMHKIAVTDALTGVYNRTFFGAEMTRIEFGRDYPVSIIVVDLDNMKTTNDRLGHASGDQLLKHTVQVLQGIFRTSDIIARIGGDEFAMLLPKTDVPAASHMLSRIRSKIDDHNIEHPALPILLSMGASTVNKGSLVEALNIADQRMYEDKAVRKSSR